MVRRILRDEPRDVPVRTAGTRWCPDHADARCTAARDPPCQTEHHPSCNVLALVVPSLAHQASSLIKVLRCEGSRVKIVEAILDGGSKQAL